MREGLVADIACERRDIAEELEPAQERRSDDREGKGSPSLPDLDATEQPKNSAFYRTSTKSIPEPI